MTMLLINATSLATIAKALLSGRENIVEKIIEDKLEDLGKEVIRSIIPFDFGVVGRAAEALSTGGRSEVDRMRSQWLNSLMPVRTTSQGVAGRFQRAFLRNEHLLTRPEGKWQRWSRSRQEWLDERWRHDWRSQPRDWRGRWTPGRLRHPYISKGARRIRRARRQAARSAARGIISSWGR